VSECPSYWRGAVEDEAMQDEYGFVWEAMLDTIDIDVAGKRALDAGCNRGGFLRFLCDEYEIAEGRGYDRAAVAIDDARRLASRRGTPNPRASRSPPRAATAVSLRPRARRPSARAGAHLARSPRMARVLQRPQAPDAMHAAVA
jgi:hypothetical protein